MHRAGRAARGVEVARNRDRALHLARDLRVLSWRVVGHRGHRELRRARARRDVGVREVGVAQLAERVIAHGQEAARLLVARGDSEVPSEVERLAVDARLAERGEQVLHVRAARLDAALQRGHVVPEHAEAVARGDRLDHTEDLHGRVALVGPAVRTADVEEHEQRTQRGDHGRDDEQYFSAIHGRLTYLVRGGDAAVAPPRLPLAP